MNRFFIIPAVIIALSGCSSPEAEAPTEISELPIPTAASETAVPTATPVVAPTIMVTPTTASDAPPSPLDMDYIEDFQKIQASISKVRYSDVLNNSADLSAAKTEIANARNLNATSLPVPERFTLAHRYLTQGLDKHAQVLSTIATHQSMGTAYPEGQLELLNTTKLYDSAETEFKRVFKEMRSGTASR